MRKHLFSYGELSENEEHKETIKNIIKKGHYVGGHSDKHLLYASWGNREQSLVTSDSLINDLRQNIKELEKYGIKKSVKLLFASI